MTRGSTAVEGVRVGHASDCDACTGCTVILCEGGAVGGVDVRGWASGTRELDALGSHHLVAQTHGILLAGGSAFGLDAAAGVMRYLEGTLSCAPSRPLRAWEAFPPTGTYTRDRS